MLLCALLGLVIEQAAYRPLRTRAWIAPALFLGGAAGYVALWHRRPHRGRRRAADGPLPLLIGASPSGSGWALLLRTTQRRRAKRSASSRLTALITAIGVSLFLENFSVLPQIFGSEPRYFHTDEIVRLPNLTQFFGVSLSVQTLLHLPACRWC